MHMLSPAAPMPPRAEPTLTRRVLRAGSWSFAGYGVSQAIRFGSNLIMTRLLVPEMFGVMAIATMIMYGLALFSDVGLRQNVVHSRRGGEAVFLNTAWSMQILRGLGMWVLALAVSLIVIAARNAGLVPPDSVYADPSLPYVIAILTGSAVISGFESTKLSEASRSLALHRVTQIDMCSQVAGLSCMLAWVAVDRSIWALVAGNIAASTLRMVLSHAVLPGVANRWCWDDASFREIIHFGKWIFLSSILGFLVNSGDRLLLSGLLDAPALGVYVIAYLIFNSVEQVVSKIIAEVTFPALSEVVRERPADLRRTYYRFHAPIASFAYFLSGLLMVSGQTLIGMLYDPRYGAAGWMLEVLAVALLTVPLHLATQSFMALGRPRILSGIIALRLTVLVVVTPTGFHMFGIVGALWGITLSYFACWLAATFQRMKLGLFDAGREARVLPAVFLGMAAAWLLNLLAGYR
jgi:O-antigen/teichoic acid export membrane protein